MTAKPESPFEFIDCTSAARAVPRDLVFVFHGETWSDALGHLKPMGGPRLLTTLMTDSSVHRLLVANPYRSAPVQWAKWLMGRRPIPFPSNEHRAIVEPRRVRRQDPTSVRALEREYERYDQILQRAAAKLGLHRPAVIVTHPLVAGFSAFRWAGQVTYFGRDEWTAGIPLRRWWRAYDEAYVRIRNSGRAVVGVSQAIIDRIRPNGPAAVVPNGVAPEEWAKPGPPPAWFAGLSSPKILYAGALTVERLDLAAIIETAIRFPTGSIVLIGPVVDPESLNPLRRYKNIYLHSAVGREEIASIVRAAEVCIIPHLVNDLTTAMSPIKLYEYLAGGRPVAATDLPPIRAVDPRIVLVSGKKSFADGVEEALSKGPLSEMDRMAFIDANSWSRRHQKILNVALGRSGIEDTSA